MYKIEKRFTLPIGHRLSKHKGRCFSIHGHNFDVLVGIKSPTLNDNDMILDYFEQVGAGIEYLIALGSIIGVLGFVIGLIFFLVGSGRTRGRFMIIMIISLVLIGICGFQTGINYFHLNL